MSDVNSNHEANRAKTTQEIESLRSLVSSMSTEVESARAEQESCHAEVSQLQTTLEDAQGSLAVLHDDCKSKEAAYTAFSAGTLVIKADW